MERARRAADTARFCGGARQDPALVDREGQCGRPGSGTCSAVVEGEWWATTADSIGAWTHQAVVDGARRSSACGTWADTSSLHGDSTGTPLGGGQDPAPLEHLGSTAGLGTGTDPTVVSSDEAGPHCGGGSDPVVVAGHGCVTVDTGTAGTRAHPALVSGNRRPRTDDPRGGRAARRCGGRHRVADACTTATAEQLVPRSDR